jgi:hypothetical protein
MRGTRTRNVGTRVVAPLEPYFEKTWRPGAIGLVTAKSR